MLNVQDLGVGAMLLSYLNQSFSSSNEYLNAVRGPERPVNPQLSSLWSMRYVIRYFISN